MRKLILLATLFGAPAWAVDWSINRVCNGDTPETAAALLLSRSNYWPSHPGINYLFVIKDAGVIEYFQSKNIGVPNLAFGANVRKNWSGQLEMLLNPWGTAAWERERFPTAYFVDSSFPVRVEVRPQDNGVLVNFFAERNLSGTWQHQELANWFFQDCWYY